LSNKEPRDKFQTVGSTRFIGVQATRMW